MFVDSNSTGATKWKEIKMPIFKVTAEYRGNCKDYPDFEEEIEAEDEEDAIETAIIDHDLFMFYAEPIAKRI